jgi:hypothetical protein
VLLYNVASFVIESCHRLATRLAVT